MNEAGKPQYGLILLLLAGLLAGCATTLTHAPAVTVVETDNLADAADRALALAGRHGRDDVLVAFDLDNTLLAMRSELGSDQWYDWQRELQNTDHCDPRLVADRLATQGALFHAGAMRATQEDAADIVRRIQQAGVPTMVLTARGQSFRLSTFRELRRNGLDFRDSAPGPRGGIDQAFVPDGGSRPVRFEDGVYLLAGQHKGEMLLQLFDRIDMAPPEAVIFVDDKRKNIEAVRTALESAGIHGELYHYRREGKRVASFDAQAANSDWQRLAPALHTIETVLGSWNFDLPEPDEIEACQ